MNNYLSMFYSPDLHLIEVMINSSHTSLDVTVLKLVTLPVTLQAHFCPYIRR